MRAITFMTITGHVAGAAARRRARIDITLRVYSSFRGRPPLRIYIYTRAYIPIHTHTHTDPHTDRLTVSPNEHTRVRFFNGV